MAFAEKDTIVTQLFHSPGAAVNLIDAFDATMDAVNTKAHSHHDLSSALERPLFNNCERQPERNLLPRGRPARKRVLPLAKFALRQRERSRF
jgi:hypothetical protein